MEGSWWQVTGGNLQLGCSLSAFSSASSNVSQSQHATCNLPEIHESASTRKRIIRFIRLVRLVCLIRLVHAICTLIELAQIVAGAKWAPTTVRRSGVIKQFARMYGQIYAKSSAQVCLRSQAVRKACHPAGKDRRRIAIGEAKAANLDGVW